MFTKKLKPMVYQRNLFKHFFHIIFFPGKYLVKNLLTINMLAITMAFSESNMRLFVCQRFLLNTGSSLKFFRNNSHQKFNSWWVLNFIIKTNVWKYSYIMILKQKRINAPVEINGVCPQCRKPFRKLLCLTTS